MRICGACEKEDANGKGKTRHESEEIWQSGAAKTGPTEEMRHSGRGMRQNDVSPVWESSRTKGEKHGETVIGLLQHLGQGLSQGCCLQEAKDKAKNLTENDEEIRTGNKTSPAAVPPAGKPSACLGGGWLWFFHGRK